MKMTFVIYLLLQSATTVANQDTIKTANSLYTTAFQNFEEKSYIQSERNFEKAFATNRTLTYAAYMVGYLNLYFLDDKNYVKAAKYLSIVEKVNPVEVNKNYLNNHIGIAYLYSALDKKSRSKEYIEDLKNAEHYFRKALNFGANDITYNNIGRALIEYKEVEKINESIIYFDKAINIIPNPAYVHNKAAAYERLGHHYSGLVKGDSYSYENRNKSYEYFKKALEVYKSNSSYAKSVKQAELIEQEILLRKAYEEFK